jgi:hypothetical protein
MVEPPRWQDKNLFSSRPQANLEGASIVLSSGM